MNVGELLGLLKFTNATIPVTLTIDLPNGETIEVSVTAELEGRFKEVQKFALRATLPDGWAFMHATPEQLAANQIALAPFPPVDLPATVREQFEETIVQIVDGFVPERSVPGLDELSREEAARLGLTPAK